MSEDFHALDMAMVDFAPDKLARAMAQADCAHMCPNSVAIEGTHIGGSRTPSGKGMQL